MYLAFLSFESLINTIKKSQFTLVNLILQAETEREIIKSIINFIERPSRFRRIQQYFIVYSQSSYLLSF